MNATTSEVVVEDQSESSGDRLAMALATTGLEPESATTLRAAFESMFANADEWVSKARLIKVTSVDQKHEMKLARVSRLALRDIRVNAEKARKRLKEDSVRRGKAIDGIANVLKALIEPIEEHLLEQETFADRVEAARKDALKAAREQTLTAYGVDPNVYANLGETSEVTWASIHETARVAHEAKVEAAKQAEIVRLEAERIAEETRQKALAEAARVEAERIERERLQAEENARLKREAAEREEALRVEREAADAERKRIEAEAKAEREAAEASARAEREAANAEKSRLEAEARAARDVAEEETRRAREATAKAEAELAATRAASAKAAREREAAETARVEADAARAAAEEATRQASLLAPDKEKLTSLAESIRRLTVPAMSTDKGKSAAIKVADQLTKMAAWVEKTGMTL